MALNMHPYIIGGHITTLSHKQGFKAFPQLSTRLRNVWEYIPPALLLRPNIAFVSLYYDVSPPTDAILHPFHLLSWNHFKEPTSVLRLCSLVSLVGESASVLMVGLAVAPSSLPFPSGIRCKYTYNLNTLNNFNKRFKYV